MLELARTADVGAQLRLVKRTWIRISTGLSRMPPQISAARRAAFNLWLAEGGARVSADGRGRRRVVHTRAADRVDDRDGDAGPEKARASGEEIPGRGAIFLIHAVTSPRCRGALAADGRPQEAAGERAPQSVPDPQENVQRSRRGAALTMTECMKAPLQIHVFHAVRVLHDDEDGSASARLRLPVPWPARGFFARGRAQLPGHGIAEDPQASLRPRAGGRWIDRGADR